MKKLSKTLLLVFLVFYSNRLFATTDQTRTLLFTNKDSLHRTIVEIKQSIDKDQAVIGAAKKIGGNNKTLIDSVTRHKDSLTAQLNILNNQAPESKDADVQSITLSIATLIFGAILILAVLFLKIAKNSNDMFHTYKLIGIMFIGTVSVFLIPAGFNNEQITPVVGLLGTLAGYLVGTSQSRDSNSHNTTPEN